VRRRHHPSPPDAGRRSTCRRRTRPAAAPGSPIAAHSAWFIALYCAVVLELPTLLLDADATSQSAYDWFKVAQAEGFEIPANLVVERYPFDDIAEYIREKRSEFGAIVVDAGGGSSRIFHEAVTEAMQHVWAQPSAQ
jgi:hypothetical protein